MQNLAYIMLEKKAFGELNVEGVQHFSQGCEICSEKGGIYLKWNYDAGHFIFNNDEINLY